MKLQQITEMAAKKLCAICGKTMAANHFWYKGGWRCKKSALADIQSPDAGSAEQQVVRAAQPTPQQPPIQQQPAPQPKPTVPTKPADFKEVRSMFPEIDWQEDDMGGDIWWQVSEYKGKINVSWEYTFRRDTILGAFADKQRLINAANTRLAQVANKFADSLISINQFTIADARREEQRQIENGNDAYSEYEQSFGGQLTLLG